MSPLLLLVSALMLGLAWMDCYPRRFPRWLAIGLLLVSRGGWFSKLDLLLGRREHGIFWKRLSLLGLVWLAIVAQATAQTLGAPDPLPASFLPKSPTVSPFQRFDQQQNVNLITGAAQATVPLADLRSGPLHTVVALNYSFGGLKVVQPQDLVGLGWSLQAGGVISRRVVGRPDDEPGGYGRYNTDSVFANHPVFLRTAYYGNADPSPDVYDFTAGTAHGRFLVQDTSVVLLPKQPLEIRRFRDGSGFQIATETEGRYLFQNVEVTVPNAHNFPKLGAHNSAWQLTQIISPGNADTIRFHYSTHAYREPGRTGQTSLQVLAYINVSLYNYLDSAPVNSYVSGSTIRIQVLDSITTRGARVLLRRDAQLVLQQVITVSTVRGRRAVGVVELGHSRFGGAANQTDRRLRLDWVQQRNGDLRLPAYRFAYDTAFSLPPPTSTGQDHWGYYNGADQNGAGNVGSALLPHPLLQSQGLSPDREPHFPFAQTGALRCITYPTGGYTTFAYEPNRYGVPVKVKNVPLVKNLQAFLVSPLRLDVNRLRPTSYRSFGDLAGDSAVFSLPRLTTVSFSLVVRPLLANNPDYSDKRYDVMLLKRGSTSDSVIYVSKSNPNEEQQWELDLSAGNYVVWVLSEPQIRFGDMFAEDGNALTVSLPHQVYLPDVAGNGIRVQQTVTAASGALPLTRTYTYLCKDSTGVYSSGTMLLPMAADGQPAYQFKFFQLVSPTETKGYFNYTSDNTKFGDEYSRYSFYYSCVTEQEGGTGQPGGKKVYHYRHYPELFNDVRPVQTNSYQSTGNDLAGFKLAVAERYFYGSHATDAPPFEAARPYKTGDVTGGLSILGEDYGYNRDYYLLQPPFLALDTTTTVQYGATDSLVSKSYTAYVAQRPVRTTTRDSHGAQHISTLSYLSDYAPTLAGYSQLRTYNFNPVVEVQQWRRLPGHRDSLLVGGSATRFNPKWQAPETTWRLDLAQPATGLNAQTTINGLYASWLRDTRYRQMVTEHYATDTGDPVGQQVTSGPSTAYVWGYQRTELVAQVQNATASQVAYAGFEARELGRWQGQPTAIGSPGFTGGAGYALTAGLTCSDLPPGTYRVSCRQQGATGTIAANGQALTATGPAVLGWTERMATVTVGAAGTVQLVGTGQIDDVCLYPVGARLTSYTHRPLVGMTSQTGPDGRTTFYEYDALGRLLRTRDEQGRVLSQQQYHYAQH